MKLSPRICPRCLLHVNAKVVTVRLECWICGAATRLLTPHELKEHEGFIKELSYERREHRRMKSKRLSE